jgi:hypothetical protein
VAAATRKILDIALIHQRDFRILVQMRTQQRRAGTKKPDNKNWVLVGHQQKILRPRLSWDLPFGLMPTNGVGCFFDFLPAP